MTKTKSTKSTGATRAHAAAGHPQQLVIDALRALILAADDSIKEGVKWNAPSFYTTEHFATFHLRAQDRVQLILHLGAKARKDVTVRDAVGESPVALEWRGPDRAIVSFSDVADVQRHKETFTRLLRQWIKHVR